MTVIYLVLGLVLLLVGGEWLVRGAAGMARIWRVPPILIGVTIIGMGTSMPELMVSVEAAFAGAPGIAIGNVVGSNIANILLILGLSAAVTPLIAPFAKLRFDLTWMIAAAVLLPIVFYDLVLSRLEGLAFVLLLAGFLIWSVRRSEAEEDDGEPPSSLPVAAVTAAVGLGGILIGAWLLVDSASNIARYFGISEAVIGLTIVAIGTSLPEMATSVIAAMRGQRDLAIGNAVGSNIFNILAILGLTAMVKPIEIDPRFLTLDVWIVIAVSLVLGAVIFLRNGLSRSVGLGFLAVYVAYLAFSALSGSVSP